MIILDTHIWIWWVSNDSRLNPTQQSHIAQHQSNGLGISIISCWEIAKAVETKGLQLTLPVEDWLNSAIAYPGIQLLPLTLAIVVAEQESAETDPLAASSAIFKALCVKEIWGN